MKKNIFSCLTAILLLVRLSGVAQSSACQYSTCVPVMPFSDRDRLQIYGMLANIYSVLSSSASANYWGVTGNAISTNTNFIGATTNRSLLFYTNNTQRLKLDSVGRLSVSTSTASNVYFDQTWSRFGIRGAAWTASLGAAFDGFWFGTLSNHNLNFFTNSGVPAISVSSQTSGAVNGVYINPVTYTWSAQLSVNAGGGTNIFDVKNNTEATTYFRVRTSNGETNLKHLGGLSSAPTLTLGTGAGVGSGATFTLTNATDLAGMISITTGTGAITASAPVFTLTFNSAYTTAPVPVLSPGNTETAFLSGTTAVFSTATTTTFILTAGTVSLAAGTVYRWYYHMIQ
jgi:hypothetical protein